MFDHGRGGHDFDLPLVLGKRHPPAETLFVETAQPRLVTVVVRRPQHSSAEPAPGHAGKVSLQRLRLGHFYLVKILTGKTERIRFQKGTIERDRAVLTQLK